jgi:hypothetical protein
MIFLRFSLFAIYFSRAENRFQVYFKSTFHWRVGPAYQRLSRHAPCADWLPGVALSIMRTGIKALLRQRRSEPPSCLSASTPRLRPLPNRPPFTLLISPFAQVTNR